jgi:MacB-like periplasmic core domain
MASICEDVRDGLRMFAKSPGFTAIAVLTVALGIGATTTIFGVIDSVLLDAFRYKNADRLATPSIRLRNGSGIPRFPVTAFLDFREQNHTFDDMIGLAYLAVRYASREGTECVQGGWVGPDAFVVLGSRPLLGRSLTSEDGNPDSPPVLFFCHELSTMGQGIQQGPEGARNDTASQRHDEDVTSIAVMPPRFQFGGCDIWIPLSLDSVAIISHDLAVSRYLISVMHLGHSRRRRDSPVSQIRRSPRAADYGQKSRCSFACRGSNLTTCGLRAHQCVYNAATCAGPPRKGAGFQRLLLPVSR